MIFLGKHHTIHSCSINNGYFDTHDSVSCQTGVNHSFRAVNNGYVYTYNLSYFAKSNDDNTSFIECISHLSLRMKPEDEGLDTVQIADAIKDFQQYVIDYLKDHTPEHFSKLEFPGFEVTEATKQSIRQQLSRLKELKPWNKMSGLERKLANMTANHAMISTTTKKTSYVIENPDGENTVVTNVVIKATHGTLE